jgi:hypothetical protein
MTAVGGDAVRVSYVPGAWVAVAGRRTWLLVDLDPSSEAVGQLWELQRDGAGHLEVLSALTGLGLGRIPSFVLGGLTATGLTVVLGGAGRARVGREGTEGELTAVGFTTWSEHTFEHPEGDIELIGEGAAVGAELPFSVGVVRACRLRVEFGSSPAVEPGLPAATGRVDAAVPGVRPVAPEAAVAPAPAPQGREASQPAAELPAETLTAAVTRSFREAVEPAVPGPEPPSGVTLPPSVEPAIPPAQDTQVAEVTTRRAPPGVPGPTAPARVAAPPGGAPPAPPPIASPTPAPQGRGGGLIDHVPWGAPSPPPPTRAPSSPAPSAPAGPLIAPGGPPDDTDGLTISREVQESLLRRAAVPGELPRPGPLVHAVECPNGHPNPALAVTCRVCHAEVPDANPVTVPRPVLGVLRMSTGDAIPLDRGVLMGRGPTPSRLVDGERPHLVKVASPDKQISRTHLEIRLDEWHVLVTDLGSTNGTLVTLPGRAPERLRPDAPMQIEPGTTVALADEVSFRFEVGE